MKSPTDYPFNPAPPSLPQAAPKDLSTVQTARHETDTVTSLLMTCSEALHPPQKRNQADKRLESASVFDELPHRLI